MRIIGDIVLAGFGQIKNARIDNVSTDPVAPAAGQVWYNTADAVYRGYTGAEVITFATGGNTQVILDALAAETAARQAADAALTSALTAETAARQDADTAESTARAAADTQLRTDFEAADAAINTALAAETAARTAADTAEAAARVAADADINTALAAETSARQAADAALDLRVVAVEGSYINKDGSVAFTANQSMGSHKLTAVATPEAEGDAANKAYVDGRIANLGAAFEYVGIVEGGASAGAAFDLSTLSKTSAGSYYKVVVAGFVKQGAEGAAVYVNQNDGVVFNTASGFDIVDNSNSQVHGTALFVDVTGNSDTGFTVDLSATFKGRVDSLETNLAAESAARTAADTTINAAIASETAAREAADTATNTALAAETSAREAEDTALSDAIVAEEAARVAADDALSDRIDGADGVALALATSVGANADGTLKASSFTHDNFDGAADVIEAINAVNNALVGLNTRVLGGHFVYESSSSATVHTVTHSLGQKYCQVVVVDSNDKVVIPDSITFNTDAELVVEFIAAMNCRVVVTAPFILAV